MNSSLTNTQVGAQVLPTSTQIEQWYHENFKGMITLAVNRKAGEGQSFFPIDSNGCVSLIVAIRKNETDHFRSAWTGQMINDSDEKYEDYEKHRATMSGHSGIICLFVLNRWAEAYIQDVAPLEMIQGEGIFSYLNRTAVNVFDLLDKWLLENVAVVLHNNKDYQGQANLKIKMINGKDIPMFFMSFRTLRSNISLISPKDNHPDAGLLGYALSYEKKINESSLEEAKNAYSGCVNVDVFIEKARNKYLDLLRSASPEFRSHFNIV